MDKNTLFFGLARFVLRELVGDAAGALIDGLRGHLTDHSRALLKALDGAAEQTGKVCELVFDARFTDRLLASGEARALALPLQQLLEARGDAFKRQCRDEWQRARGQGPLAAEPLDVVRLAQGTSGLQRIGDPQGLIREAVALMAAQSAALRQAGYPGLAECFEARLAGDTPFLPALYGYFVRRAVADDPRLAAQLQFDALQRITGVPELIDDHTRRILNAVQALKGDLRPQHSFSLHSEAERQVVLQLRDIFRALPAERQAQLPRLLQGWAGRSSPPETPGLRLKASARPWATPAKPPTRPACTTMPTSPPWRPATSMPHSTRSSRPPTSTPPDTPRFRFKNTGPRPSSAQAGSASSTAAATPGSNTNSP